MLQNKNTSIPLHLQTDIDPRIKAITKGRPLIPLCDAAAIIGCSRNNFNSFYGHLIKPREIPNKTRPMYVTDEVLELAGKLKNSIGAFRDDTDTFSYSTAAGKKKPFIDYEKIIELTDREMEACRN